MEVTQQEEQDHEKDEEKAGTASLRSFMSVQDGHEVKYKKQTTCADIKGQKYEIKMAALLFLRGINSGTKFFLASNISGVGQFDDLVFVQNNKVFLVQLKHKRNKIRVKFCSDRKFSDTSTSLTSLHGNFSVPQYFRSYAECRKWLHDCGLCSTVDSTQFVLFTNRALETKSKCDADKENVLFTEGNVYRFTEAGDDAMFKLLQQLEAYSRILRGEMVVTDIKNANIKRKIENLRHSNASIEKERRIWGDLSDHKEFLSQFRVYSSQSNERGLDTLIKAEIRRACMANDVNIDSIFDKLFREMEDWWENKNFFLTEKTKFWQDIMHNHISNLCPIKTLEVEFREEEYILLRTFLIFNQILQIETQGSTDLICTKVRKSLKNCFPLMIDDLTLENQQCEIIALWERWCNILVITSKGKVDLEPFQEILKDTRKKLIIIGNKISISKSTHRSYLHHERVSLNQLNEDWRKRVLQTSVRFQGQDVPFRDIVGSYAENLTAEMIVKILTREVNLEHIQAHDIDYYVPRTLSMTGKENIKFQNVDSVLDIPLEVVVLSAEPGMGKSTLLTHLVLGTKQVCPEMWVVRINLNDYTQLLNNEPDHMKLSDVIEFILEVSGIPEYWKPLFRYKLENMNNVCIFFDGYDEVSPTHSEKVADILKTLQKNNLKKLWVTTRPIMKGKLESDLKTLAISLEPFSETDQKNFLQKFWMRNKTEGKTILLNQFISGLLKLIAMNLNDRDRDFTGIPLQSLLLAEAFEKDLKCYLENGIFEINPKLDLLELYNKFIDRKLQIYYSKNNIDMTKPGLINDYEQFRRTFEDNHMVAALLVLFPKEELSFAMHKNGKRVSSKILSMTNIQATKSQKFKDPFKIIENAEIFLKNIESGREKTGIIRDVFNGKPMFIHRTFAEYFAALWFAKNFSKVREYLEKNLFNLNFHIVRKFFDRILAQNHKLHIAVLNQRKDSVETLLVEGNVDIDERDEGGRTALHLAVISYLDAKESMNIRQSSVTANEIISLLLEHGASHTIKDHVLTWRPLRLADKFNAWAAIDLILKRQGDTKDLSLLSQNINKRDFVQQLLGVVARHGFINLLDFLLKRGIDLEQCISIWHVYKTTPLHEAASHGQLEVVKFLVRNKADVNAVDEWCKRSPLLWAVDQGETEVVKFLLKCGSRVNTRDTFDNTALQIAAIKGHWDIVQLLVQNHSDVISRDKNGNTLLHYASQSGEVQCVSTLLDMGFDVNARNKRLESPFLRAAWWGKYETVKLLSQREADVTARDKDGNTALHAAAKSGNMDILVFLLELGVDVNSRNLRNETPVTWAAWFGKLEAVRCLCENGADLQAKDSVCGFTPLHAATSEGNLDIVEYLVAHGASLSDCDVDGNTPLQVGKNYCYSDNRTDVINFLEKLSF